MISGRPFFIWHVHRKFAQKPVPHEEAKERHYNQADRKPNRDDQTPMTENFGYKKAETHVADTAHVNGVPKNLNPPPVPAKKPFTIPTNTLEVKGSIDPVAKKPVRPSYKTELSKMRDSRNFWRSLVIAFGVGNAIGIIYFLIERFYDKAI